MKFDITNITNNVLVPIIVTIIINYFIKLFELYKQHKDYLAKKREKQYSDLLQLLYKSITESKNKNMDKELIKKELFKFTLNLPMWANKEIISCFNDFRQSLLNTKSDKEKILADLINLIRKDLGLKKIDPELIINIIFPKNEKENRIE